jgi:hypothetical protein
MALLINKAACKKAILNVAEARHQKFTRVGSDVFEHLNSLLMNHITSIVTKHPSIGCTISMGTRKRGKKENEADPNGHYEDIY